MPQLQKGFPGEAVNSVTDFVVARGGDLPKLNANGWKRLADFCKRIMQDANAANDRSAAASNRLKDQLVRREVVADNIQGCRQALAAHLVSTGKEW